MTIRLLTSADWSAMSRLRITRRTHGGVPVSKFSFNPVTSVHPRYQVAPHLAVGSFGENAFICAYTGGPEFWVLDLMVSGGDPKPLRSCLQFCLDHYETRGVFQFYYAFPEKWARSYRSFWKDGVEELRKYKIEDVRVIEANKVCSDEFTWNHVLHQSVVPVPFLLRRSYVD